MQSLNFHREASTSTNPISNGVAPSNGTTQEFASQSRSNVSRISAAEKTYFFTGTAERVLAWNRVFKHRCFFEVIASVLSIQESHDDTQNIILLKDKKGPILQVIHYVNHVMQEEEFTSGQMLRCVGYMTKINTMTAVNIRRATAEELASLKRYCHIGDFSISGLINAEDNQ